MTPYETIMLSAETLPNGQTISIICPWCVGGRTREVSLYITRFGAVIKYHCFRASCVGSSSGQIGGIRTAQAVKEKGSPTPHVFDWDTYPLTDGALEWLWTMYYIYEDIAFYYRLSQSVRGDVVVPMFARTGERTGNIVKLRNPNGRPKILTYPGESSSGLSWFMGAHEPTERLIIVEDSFSAIRASEYLDAVALLSTNMNDTKAQEIAAGKYKEVLLCLDADATAVSVRIAKRYRAYLPNVRVVSLVGPDLKNRTQQSLNEFFKELL